MNTQKPTTLHPQSPDLPAPLTVRPSVSEKQLGLLRVLSRFHWARPGDCKCHGYSHAIGANNGLKGLVTAGLAEHQTRFQKRGIRSHGGACLTINVYQITDAGRALLT